MNTPCRTYEWVMSHIRMSHVTHINKSFSTYEWVASHTYGWVVSHMWMSHVPHTNKLCHAYAWVVPRTYEHVDESCTTCATPLIHTCVTRLIHIRVWYTNKLCHTYAWVVPRPYEWVQSHVQMSPVAHMNESCRTCEWGTHVCRAYEHICDMTRSYVAHTNESCHKYEGVMTHTHEWVLSHTRMSHVAHTHESCITYEHIPSHLKMSHVTSMKTSWHLFLGGFFYGRVFRLVRCTYRWGMTHVWMSHDTDVWIRLIAHRKEPCRTRWYRAPFPTAECLDILAHMNETWPTYEWVMPQTYGSVLSRIEMSHVAHTNTKHLFLGGLFYGRVFRLVRFVRCCHFLQVRLRRVFWCLVSI